LAVLPNLFEQKQANKKSSTPVQGFLFCLPPPQGIMK
jgi:hypothetical protein